MTLALLVIVGFIAGVQNSLAGGGSFLWGRAPPTSPRPWRCFPDSSPRASRRAAASGALIGGQAGARAFHRVDEKVLRVCIVLLGIGLAHHA